MESLCATSTDSMGAAATMTDVFSCMSLFPEEYRLEILGRQSQLCWRMDSNVKLTLSRRPKTTPNRFLDWR